eukprot:CFRG7427T1
MDETYSENYLDKYLNHIRDLPLTLSAKASTIADLNQQADDLVDSVTLSHAELYAELCGTTVDERRAVVDEVKECYQKALQVCDKKVEVAQSMYSMIDKHIRKLDSDVKRLDKRILVVGNGTPQKRTKYGRKQKQRRRKSDTARIEMEVAAEALPKIDIEVEMPVDPNEPTYCICQQV